MSSLPLHDLDQNDSHFEEEIERSSHERHVEEIGSRRGHGRNDGNQEDRISAVSSQKGRVDNSQDTQQGQDKREFKGEPKSKNEDSTEGGIFRHRDHRFDVGGLIS